jgi:hypothetical protein
MQSAEQYGSNDQETNLEGTPSHRELPEWQTMATRLARAAADSAKEIRTKTKKDTKAEAIVIEAICQKHGRAVGTAKTTGWDQIPRVVESVSKQLARGEEVMPRGERFQDLDQWSKELNSKYNIAKDRPSRPAPTTGLLFPQVRERNREIGRSKGMSQGILRKPEREKEKEGAKEKPAAEGKAESKGGDNRPDERATSTPDLAAGGREKRKGQNHDGSRRRSRTRNG